jgi:hypothetical protein
MNYEYNPERNTIDFFVGEKKNGVITYRVWLHTKQILVISRCKLNRRGAQVWGDWVDEEAGINVLVRVHTRIPRRGVAPAFSP